MDKTGFPEISKIWPDSTCVISDWRKGQILLVAGNPVLSTTTDLYIIMPRWTTYDVPATNKTTRQYERQNTQKQKNNYRKISKSVFKILSDKILKKNSLSLN